jgi:hypothetical protein
LISDSILSVSHDLLHVIKRHDLVQSVQRLITSLQTLHHLDLDLCELYVLNLRCEPGLMWDNWGKFDERAADN